MTQLFDPIAAWRSLPPEVQERIGAAAIVHTLGVFGIINGLDPRQGFIAADNEGLGELGMIVQDEVEGAFVDDMPCRPDLAAIGIGSCRVCGCTQDCACEGGCSWIEEDLCSTCAPR